MAASLRTAGPGQLGPRVELAYSRHSPVPTRARSHWLGTRLEWGEDSRRAGLDRVEGADIRRAGPTRATANKVLLGRKVRMIMVTRVIGITASLLDSA